MKKIIFSITALALILGACDNDDDGGTDTPDGVLVSEAAELTGGPYTFCVDGVADNISTPIEEIVVDAGSGSFNNFVVTDTDGNILGLPEAPSGPNFDGAGVGTCYLYHINYEEGLEGLSGPNDDGPTANINDLEGDFALSNFLTVNRIECVTVAAVLEGGPYNFCVDGLEDRVMDDVVSDAGEGTNSTFVITDEDLNVLGLPGVVSGPEFDEAGVGTCLIWHLNYEGDPETYFDGITNAAQLMGDFALSNSLVVNREDCAPSVVAAELMAGASADEDGEYNFVVDGTADNVTDLVVVDAGMGENQQIVVTDTEGNILGLPPVFEGPDFDAAGVGICYIYHINFDGMLTGLTGLDANDMPTANINDLEGDFKVSNFIVVNRTQ